MKRVRLGVGGKIFIGFLVLVVVAMVMGGMGNYSLRGVIGQAGDEEMALGLQTQMLEARRQEKNYLLRGDEQSIKSLEAVLNEINGRLAALKERGVDPQQARMLAESLEGYKNAAAELKRLTKEDANLNQELQGLAEKMSRISQETSDKAVLSTRDKVVENLKGTMNKNMVRQISDVVNIAYRIIDFMHASGEEQEKALALMRSLRFGDNQFFLVLDNKGMLMVHGNQPGLEGVDMTNIQDEKSKKFFYKELVKAAVGDGEAEVEHFLTKPGGGEAVPVLTVGRYFEPWGLVLCASIYMDEVERKTQFLADMLSYGLNEIRAALEMDNLTVKAWAAALYYFKFNRQSVEVARNLNRLTRLEMATAELKSQAQAYQNAFARQVANERVRKEQVSSIQNVARHFLETSGNLSKQAQANFHGTASQGQALLLYLMLAGAVVGLGLAWLLARTITRPVKRAIAGLRQASEQVALSSGQVSNASQSLAQGASQQASSLEETSAALEEMASMSRRNAENAQQANQLMAQTRQVVEQANASMKDLKGAMSQITAASDQTAKIIKTIDEIAFQTNLLALNAAVEAARAGEAGAGFAVVAGEVRSLAQRAAEAAKNTSQLIEGNLTHIRRGSDLVENTDQAFDQVEQSAGKVAELLAEINAASAEQAQGVDQLNQAVLQMDKVTQQNAANAEETSASSEEMKSQAGQMAQYVDGLVALVRGGRERGPGKKKRPKLLPAPRAGAPEQKAPPASQESAGGDLAPVPAPGPAKKPKPEEVIPLDEDFKDF